MSKSEFESIPEDLEIAYQLFAEDYLADVLRPWDCYAQDWHNDHTILYRFEKNDLLIYKSNHQTFYRIGPIDTSTFGQEMLSIIGINEWDAVCLSWNYADDLKKLIGRKGLYTGIFDIRCPIVGNTYESEEKRE